MIADYAGSGYQTIFPLKSVKIQLSFISLCWNVLCSQMFIDLAKPVKRKLNVCILFNHIFKLT